MSILLEDIIMWPHPLLPKEPVYPYGIIPIHEYLEKHSNEEYDRPFIIYYGKIFTYGEINDYSNRFANLLLSKGFKRNDRVAVLLPNTPQLYIAYFGTFKAGGILAFLNPFLKEIELEYYLREVKPKVLVVIDTIYDLITDVCKKLNINPLILVTSYNEVLPRNPEIPLHPSMTSKSSGDFFKELEKYQNSKPNISVNIEDYATMHFTSGTSGLPKGVIHKHRGITYKAACFYTYHHAHLLLDSNFKTFNDFLNYVYSNETVLIFIPLFWIMGHDLGLAYSTFSGAKVILLTRWDIEAVLKAIEKYKVTTIYGPFDIYYELVNYKNIGDYNLRSLRTCTGTSFNKTITRELRAKFRELTGCTLREHAYGLTESHSTCTITGGFHKDDMDILRAEKVGGVFCGIPMPGTQIRIVDETGKDSKFGEIVIKSLDLTDGYFNNPTETEKSFKNGWFYTGDIGFIDEDGFLYFMGRKKYMIKVSGVSVSPDFIEYIISKHPAVEKVGVIGVSDEEKGQVPIAFVKLRYNITENELLEWCKRNMAWYNVPKRIILLPSLPLTESGKVRREELIKIYNEIYNKR
ncbi:MAG: AMP-binding protein [Saccharolobus sp.]|uniref:AMP-binding protein n=1 Tax=Saccharolobus sp. TaxID=2100761 RepID=UPI0028CC0041|nr:AMP-binding protein [Saccharolobus sp.]MDT7862041.1 AMP-binding protein [Saccharolobus sp.]